jgi:hypothetical protein
MHRSSFQRYWGMINHSREAVIADSAGMLNN